MAGAAASAGQLIETELSNRTTSANQRRLLRILRRLGTLYSGEPNHRPMYGFQISDDYQPLGWIGKYPIHAATLLVIVHVLTMIATAIAFSAGFGSWLANTLAFSSPAIFQRFAFWQFVTYPFINSPSIWFLIEMYLLFSFGREVERFIGRRAFLSLYALLVLVPACLLTAIGLFVPSRLIGSGTVNFCVFIAFATIYPNVRLMFGLVVKWVALALLAVYSLQIMASTDWTGILVLWASAFIAFAGIRRLRGQPILEGLGIPGLGGDHDGAYVLHEQKPIRTKKPKKKALSKEEEVENVDSILDKISKRGIGSLTSRERALLERASKKLSSKDRHH